MNLVILDYNCHEARVFKYPEGKSQDSEDVEEYIETELKIKVTNTDWMLTEADVNFE